MCLVGRCHLRNVDVLIEVKVEEQIPRASLAASLRLGQPSFELHLRQYQQLFEPLYLTIPRLSSSKLANDFSLTVLSIKRLEKHVYNRQPPRILR